MSISYRDEQLKVLGHNGELIPNTFFRLEMAPHGLAIVLPGGGYSAQMPILYCSVSASLEAGFDVLSVDYSFRDLKARQALDFYDRFLGAVRASAATALHERPYSRLLVIGKSIGTRAMAHFFGTNDDPFKVAGQVERVWLTPCWNDDDTLKTLEREAQRSVHVIGTADPFYSRSKHERLSRAGADVVAIPDADHSLDIDGDLDRTIDALKITLNVVRSSLSRLVNAGPGT